MQNDVHLVRAIEAEIGKQLDEFECKENEVLADITKVWVLLGHYMVLSYDLVPWFFFPPNPLKKAKCVHHYFHKLTGGFFSDGTFSSPQNDQ